MSKEKDTPKKPLPPPTPVPPKQPINESSDPTKTERPKPPSTNKETR